MSLAGIAVMRTKMNGDPDQDPDQRLTTGPSWEGIVVTG